MNWEITAANEALKAADTVTRQLFNKSLLDCYREFPNNEVIQAALRYAQTVVPDEPGPLIRN